MMNLVIYRIDCELAQLHKMLAQLYTNKARVEIEDRIAELEATRAQFTDEAPFNPMTDEAWEAESIMMAKLYGVS